MLFPRISKEKCGYANVLTYVADFAGGRTATVTAAHTTLSTARASVAAALARTFRISSTDCAEERKDKHHRDYLFHKEHPPSLILISGLTLSLLDIMGAV